MSLGDQVAALVRDVDRSLLARAEHGRERGKAAGSWWSVEAGEDERASYVKPLGLALTALTLPEALGMIEPQHSDEKSGVVVDALEALVKDYSKGSKWYGEPGVGRFSLILPDDEPWEDLDFLDSAVWAFTGALYSKVWAKEVSFQFEASLSRKIDTLLQEALTFINDCHVNDVEGADDPGGWFWTKDRTGDLGTSFLYYTAIAVDTLVDVTSLTGSGGFDVYLPKQSEAELKEASGHVREAAPWIIRSYGSDSENSIASGLLAFPDEDAYLREADETEFVQGKSAYYNLYALLTLLLLQREAGVDPSLVKDGVQRLLESLDALKKKAKSKPWSAAKVAAVGWAPGLRIGIFCRNYTGKVELDKFPRDNTLLPLAIKVLSMYAKELPPAAKAERERVQSYLVGDSEWPGLVGYLVQDMAQDSSWSVEDFSIAYTERAVEALYRIHALAADSSPIAALAELYPESARGAGTDNGASAGAPVQLGAIEGSLAAIARSLDPLGSEVLRAASEQGAAAAVDEIKAQLNDKESPLFERVSQLVADDIRRNSLPVELYQEIIQRVLPAMSKDSGAQRDALADALAAMASRGKEFSGWLQGDEFARLSDGQSADRLVRWLDSAILDYLLTQPDNVGLLIDDAVKRAAETASATVTKGKGAR